MTGLPAFHLVRSSRAHLLASAPLGPSPRASSLAASPPARFSATFEETASPCHFGPRFRPSLVGPQALGIGDLRRTSASRVRHLATTVPPHYLSPMPQACSSSGPRPRILCTPVEKVRVKCNAIRRCGKSGDSSISHVVSPEYFPRLITAVWLPEHAPPPARCSGDRDLNRGTTNDGAAHL